MENFRGRGELDDALAVERHELGWVRASDICARHLEGRDLCQNELDRFASLGVTASALGNPWPIVADHVVFRDNGLFDFATDASEDQSVSVFTIVVSGLDGIRDIVAWEPRPNRLALWLGRAFALGEKEIWEPGLGGDPLPIWRSPLGWLRSGRQGLVILRPTAAPFYLDDVRAVVAEDLEHGEEVEKILTSPKPRTKILLPSRNTRSSRSAA